MLALIVGIGGCVYHLPPPPSQNLEIRDWYDLDAVRNNLAGNHILMNDLDSTTPGYEELASPRANGGKGWQAIGWGYWASALSGIQLLGEVFKGAFDGCGYVIRDLSINRDSWGGLGLFGCVGEEGIIKNVTLTNATVTNGEAVGGLVTLNGSTVRSLDVAPMSPVGILSGYNGGTVSNCYATGNASGEGGVGGLVGENDGTVSNCYGRGSVSGNDLVGGLVGVNSGTVSNSYYGGNVTSAGWVGGLIGKNNGTVSNSYYNYDELLINGESVITIGALFDEDFDEWLDNDKFLDVNERLSEENVYFLINDVSDFKQVLAFGQNDALKFRLANELDLGDESNFYIPYFAGEFDGNGHKISNLTFDFGFVSQVGLFGYLASRGKVTQVGVENVNVTGYLGVGGLVGFNNGAVSSSYSSGNVTGNDYVGGLVGETMSGSTLSNCYSTGSVTGDGHVGGLVGFNGYHGTVSNSHFTGSVTGSWYIGGLVGWNYGTVSNCHAMSNLIGEDSVGGLVGYNSYHGTVSKSYACGSVSGDGNVAALVGSNHGTISDSYSSGKVTGNWQVGGLVGWNNGIVSNCYCIGSVTGNEDVGGLMGDNYEGTVSNSFWDTTTSEQSTSDGGTGKTTEQMQDAITFSGAGWNIVTVGGLETNPSYIWNMVDGQTYPFLS
jgi:hypothetical protein